MEDNNVMKKQKSKKYFVPLIVLVVLVLGIGIAVSSIFNVNNNSDETDGEIKTEASKETPVEIDELREALSDNTMEEKTAEDEKTLRELLLEEGTFAIKLTNDVTIDKVLLVNGTKKMVGDKTVTMDIRAEAYQGVLNVSKGAKLILDGVIIDGGCIAHGVVVEEGGGLACASGSIAYGAPYGIEVMGVLLIQDIEITESIHTGVHINSGAMVYMEGGTITDAAHSGIAIDMNGYLNMSKDALLKECGYLVYNRGKADITGGTLRDSLNCLVLNYGELDIDYQGKDENDRLEWYNGGNNGIYSTDNSTTNVNGLYIHDCYYAIIRFNKTYDATVTNCVFENTQRHGIYLTETSVALENVEIANAEQNGIYQKGNSTLDINDVKISNVKLRGIENYGATVNGKNIEITSAGTFGVTTVKNGDAAGYMNLSNLTIKGTEKDCAIHCNGSVLEIDGAEVHDAGIAAINVVNDGKATVKNLKAYDSALYGIRVYKGGEATVTNVKLYRVKKDSDFIFIDKDSKLTMNGDSVVSGSQRRGICVAGTFVMNGGDVCNNGGIADKVGAGVKVNDTGIFIMNGGTIRNNTGVKAAGGGVCVTGVFEMNGGTISNNTSEVMGGGVCLVAGSTMKMTGGKIVNNTSANSGGGIYATSSKDKVTKLSLTAGEITGNVCTTGAGDGVQVSGTQTEVTVNQNFFMGNNKIKLNHYVSEQDCVKLRITGNKWNKHDTTTPLIVTPSGSVTMNSTVMECDSDASAKALVEGVASGDGQYAYYADGKYIKTGEAFADLDMSDVTDVVRVTNYQELKVAITTTTSKRIILIGADIEMEGTIQVPNGTTVQIMDDGTTRTLSRIDGFTSHFFYTRYGTGLILKGTAEDRLVLDGASSKDVDTTQIKVLVQMLGESAFTNVKFTNSDNSVYTTTKIGSYIYQQNASTTITNCTFENGKCNAGGAIRLDAKATIKDSRFINNAAVTNEGGAIYVFPGGVLNVSGCDFEGNTTVKNGGAIFYAKGAGASTIQASTFADNHATSAGNVKGGAIHIPAGVNVEISDSVFERNQVNSTEKEGMGGAILSYGSVKVTDCQFLENSANTHAGAVYVSGQNAVLIMKKTDGTALFEGNKATGYGGAILLYNTKLENVTIDGYTFQGNEGQHGGAMNVVAGASAYITNCAFSENSATARGGALDLNDLSYTEGTRSELTVVNSTFENNDAGTLGGALCVQNAKLSLTGTSGTFDTNAATNNGGAVYMNGGEFVVSDYEFKNNSSISGGAILLNAASKAELSNAKFYSNHATKDGGAIYHLATGAQLQTTSCVFGDENLGNIAGRNGGAIYLAKEVGVTTITDTKFTDNVATGAEAVKGGAIYVVSGVSAEISDSVFKNNEVTSEEGEGMGGAIQSYGSLKVTDCQFAENFANTHAGAIYVSGQNAVLTLKEDDGEGLFQKNAANGYGGAILLYDTKLENVTIDGYTFQENVGQHGGAINVVAGASAYITNCAFSENSATARGGALDLNDLSYTEGTRSELTVVNTTFDNNDAGSFGGALCVQNAKLSLRGTSGTFDTNTATNNGGAIYMNGGEFVVSDYTFKNNSSVSGGAILLNAASKAELTNVKFYSNYTEKDGGAIYNLGENIELKATNCVFGDKELGGNTARYGGAIYNVGTLLSSNCSFCGNASTENGGAVYVKSGTLDVTNCKFDSNYAASGKNGGAVFLAGTSQGTFKGEGEATNNIFTANGKLGDTAITSYGGAIAVGNSASLTVENYRFEENAAKVNGGAIHSDFDTSNTVEMTISNSTFTSNSAPGNAGANNAGGAITSDGILKLTSDTLTDNTYNNNGGAVMVYSGGRVEITNLISTTNDKINVSNTNSYAKISGVLSNVNFIITRDGGYVVTTTDFDAANSTVELTPFAYVVGKTVLKAESNTEEAKAALEEAKNKITLTQQSDDRTWYIRTDGTVGFIYTQYVKTYDELVKAIQYAVPGETIYIMNDISITEKINVDKDITLSTKVADGVTLTRESNITMFEVANSCEFGITGKVSLDGNKENLEYATHLIINRGKFTLGENAIIKDAKSNGNGPAIWSQGQLVINGTVKDCEGAGNLGGVVHVSAGSLSGSGTFTDNISNGSAGGGAIYLNSKVTAELTNATFERNKSTANAGGAIFANGNSLILTNCSFIQNEAKNNGGALYLYGTVSISGCTFENNNVTSKNYGESIAINKDATSVTLSGTNTFVAISGVTGTQVQVEDGNDDESCLFISGKVTGLSVNYSRANIKGVKIAGALDATSDIVITPFAYNVDATVVGATDSVDSTTFEAALARFSVTPEADREWVVRAEGTTGKLYTQSVKTSTELVNAITYAESGSTINLLNSFTMSNPIQINKNITLTTAASEGITITRNAAVNMFEILQGSAFEISGKVTLDGNKTDFANATHVIINRGKFTLGEEAVIQNASRSGDGAAIYSNEELVINGTVQDCVNTNATKVGAVKVDAGSISGSGTFRNNVSTGVAGILWMNKNTTATLTNVTFSNNQSSKDGGAIYNQGNLTLTNCTVVGNYSTAGSGGAIYNDANATKLDITGSVFEDNYCVASSTNGGAINCASTKGITINIADTTFSENHTTNAGGAIFVNSTATSKLNMFNCEFSSNYAKTGGAIYTYGSTTGSSCTFTGNHTSAEGGAIYIRGVSNNLTLNMNENSERGLFKENYSEQNSGGAIFVRNDLSGAISITGYDFITNKAGVNTSSSKNGGAICIDGSSASTVEIISSTFDANETNNAGGAIRCAGTLSVENCKFRNNRATKQGGAIHGGLATIKGKYYFEGNTGGVTYNGIHNDNATLADGATAYESWDAE